MTPTVVALQTSRHGKPQVGNGHPKTQVPTPNLGHPPRLSTFARRGPVISSPRFLGARGTARGTTARGTDGKFPLLGIPPNAMRKNEPRQRKWRVTSGSKDDTWGRSKEKADSCPVHSRPSRPRFVRSDEKRAAPPVLRFLCITHPALTRWANLYRTSGA